jgi:hypothetical protein
MINGLEDNTNNQWFKRQHLVLKEKLNIYSKSDSILFSVFHIKKPDNRIIRNNVTCYLNLESLLLF